MSFLKDLSVVQEIEKAQTRKPLFLLIINGF
jgi:hypothetical protein